eukprot:scaffold386538_cov16-Prasinocladus_malaysianus.AAC.1
MESYCEEKHTYIHTHKIYSFKRLISGRLNFPWSNEGITPAAVARVLMAKEELTRAAEICREGGAWLVGSPQLPCVPMSARACGHQ